MEGRKRGIRWAIWAAAVSASALLLTGAASASMAPKRGTLARALTSFGPGARGMGLTKTTPTRVSAAQTATLQAEAASLPASVDLTPYAMPVGDQGNVGSCAAWATDYSALGYWENKQGISGGGLAPMYTYSQVTGGIDQGSSIEGNLWIDEQQGVDNQADYWQGNYDYRDMPTAAEKSHAVNWKLSSFADLSVQPSGTSTVTQQSIEAALAAGTPVVIGIPVYDNFFSVGTANQGYYSGVSGNLDGYHAITALGYNPSGLVIENQWGTGWGNKGYATLSWSFVNRYVFDAVSVSSLHGTSQVLNTAAPVITGALRQGQRLTVSTGSWNPAATSYAYQWQRADTSGNWSSIGGATTTSYTPGVADLGQYLRVVVTATNAGGQGTATSAQVGPIASGAPANATAPTVSGTLRVGQLLIAGAGTWAPAGTLLAWQWQRSTDSGLTWASIPGAGGPSYGTTVGDANTYLRVLVTDTNVYGSAMAASALVGPVSGAPFSTSQPAVVGTPARGLALHATVGGWSIAPTSYAYQWQRLAAGANAWSNIPGATASSYTPAKADENARIRVQVTGSNAYGSSAVASPNLAVRASPPVNTAIPKVSGTPAVGRALSAGTGSWTGAGNSYNYQWQLGAGRGWSSIGGATRATYTATSDDRGAALRVVVTASNPDRAVSAASATTAKVR